VFLVSLHREDELAQYTRGRSKKKKRKVLVRGIQGLRRIRERKEKGRTKQSATKVYLLSFHHLVGSCWSSERKLGNPGWIRFRREKEEKQVELNKEIHAGCATKQASKLWSLFIPSKKWRDQLINSSHFHPVSDHTAWLVVVSERVYHKQYLEAVLVQ
jgi:hypothetical protein